MYQSVAQSVYFTADSGTFVADSNGTLSLLWGFEILAKGYEEEVDFPYLSFWHSVAEYEEQDGSIEQFYSAEEYEERLVERVRADVSDLYGGLRTMPAKGRF